MAKLFSYRDHRFSDEEPQRNPYTSSDGGNHDGYDPFGNTAYAGGADTIELSWDAFTPEDQKRSKKTFSRYFLGLTVYLAVAALIANLTFVFVQRSGAAKNAFFDSGLFLLLVNSVSLYLFGFVAFYLIIRRMRTVPKPKSSITFREFLLFFFVAEAALGVGAWIGNFLNDWISTILSGIFRTDWVITDDVSALIENTELWITLPFVALLGPIAEEFLFRKFMIDRLSIYGDKLAIIVSAVAFGFFHGNLYQFFYAALLGLILGYLYTKTRNVWYPIALHMAINFFSSLTVLLLPFFEEFSAMYEALEEGEQINLTVLGGNLLVIILYVLLHYGAILAGAILFFTMRKRIFISDRCEVAIPKGRRTSTAWCNVGAILFLLYCTVNILTNIFSPLLLSLLS